jgi:endonuclease/exonuclease/phosphatase family metal-dependent hydrolase
MQKAFSVLSWNVEHFKEDPSRVGDVVDLIAEADPDVFALYEVEGKDVFAKLSAKMPTYQFHITEGPQVQEILIGVRGGISAFFTQKIEFRSGTTSMRPGALLTLTIEGQTYPILFLHLSSGPDPRGWGLRDDMLERALGFREILQNSAPTGKKVNYLFLGDLNTMGLQYLLKQFNIDATAELEKFDKLAKKFNMRRLQKTAPATWSNGSKSRIKPSDLDHVIAADHLKFRSFEAAEVDVQGWAKERTTTAKNAWIKRFSDHSPLYFEVLKP